MVAAKHRGLDMGSAYVRDLGNLLGSVREGGNSVLAGFYMLSQKFFYCLLADIECWCRWAFAPILRRFMQAETLPAQKKSEMVSLIACSVVFVHF